MQLQLILKIAWHSERCVQRLHAVPSVARYCAQHKNTLVKHFTVCESNRDYIKYTLFKKSHCKDRDANGHLLPAAHNYLGKFWMLHGLGHREDRDEHGRILPAAIFANGSKFWYLNNKAHRIDRDEFGRVLPATICNDGSKFWYWHGKIHRADRDEFGRILPAVVFADGSKAWYWYGEEINPEEIDIIVK